MGIFVIGKPNIEKLKAKKDVDGLIKILKHKDRDIREEAALNIGKVGNERAVELIKKCVIASDVEQVRGRGMIVLDEVFNLSKTKLKEEFLKSKASMDTKKILKEKRVKKEKKEVKGVKFAGLKYRDDDSFGVRYNYEDYTAENKKQVWEFIKNKWLIKSIITLR